MKTTEDRSTALKTTNYPLDAHSFFCRRCLKRHDGQCPLTGGKPSKGCKL